MRAWVLKLGSLPCSTELEQHSSGTGISSRSQHIVRSAASSKRRLRTQQEKRAQGSLCCHLAQQSQQVRNLALAREPAPRRNGGNPVKVGTIKICTLLVDVPEKGANYFGHSLAGVLAPGFTLVMNHASFYALSIGRMSHAGDDVPSLAIRFKPPFLFPLVSMPTTPRSSHYMKCIIKYLYTLIIPLVRNEFRPEQLICYDAPTP